MSRAPLIARRSDLVPADFPPWVVPALDTTVTFSIALASALYVGLFTTNAYFVCMGIQFQTVDRAFLFRKTATHATHIATFAVTGVCLGAVLLGVGMVLRKRRRREAKALFWRVVVAGGVSVVILLLRAATALASLVYVWTARGPWLGTPHFGLYVLSPADLLSNVLRLLTPAFVVLLVNKPGCLCSRKRPNNYVLFEAYVN